MAHAKEEEIKAKVMKFSQPDDKKAWLSLAISIAIQIMAVGLIKINFKIMGWALHTLNQIRLFVQFHDMAHFSFFTSTTLNRFFGNLLGIYNHFPFAAWRDGHNHHHKHFGNLDRLDLSQTILFTKAQYEQTSLTKRGIIRLFREPIIFFFVTAPIIWFIGTFVPIVKRYGVLSLEFIQKMSSIILFTWVWPLMGIPSFEMWLTVYFTNVIGTMLFHIQHSVNLPYRERKDKWNNASAALQGSTYFMVPKMFKIFSMGIQYHHIHHLNTKVPSYNIQECHTVIEEEDKLQPGNGWARYKINKVDLRLAFYSLFNVMLDEEKNILTPFSYSFRENQQR